MGPYIYLCIKTKKNYFFSVSFLFENNHSSINEPISNKNSNRQTTSVGKYAKTRATSFDVSGELSQTLFDAN